MVGHAAHSGPKGPDVARGSLFGGLLLSVFGAATPVWADVTVDAASSSSTGAVAANSVTWTHTVGASPGRHLLVGVSINMVGGGKVVTSATCGVNALSLVGARNSVGEVAESRIEIWRLANPPSGACTMTVTLSAAAQFVAGAVSFFGVNSVTPLGSFVGAGGTVVPSTLTISSASGEVVFDTFATRGDTTTDPVAGAGQTQQWLIRTQNSVTGGWGGASTEPGAASVTMSWDSWSPNRHWALGSVAVKAEPNTPTPTPTNTPTSTPPTSIPTITPTNTPTITPTNTPTITSTITPTVTPTNTPTVTSTNTPTVTQTPTPTAASTATPTPTPTATPTPTPTSGGGPATLAVAKIGLPNPVALGAVLTFTVTVTNPGATAALAVTASDPLPAGTTFVSCAASQGTCVGPPVGSGGTVTAALGTVLAGGTATLSIQVQAPGSAGFLTNVVTIAGSNVSSVTATANVGVGSLAASDVPLFDSRTLALLALALVWFGLRALQGGRDSP